MVRLQSTYYLCDVKSVPTLVKYGLCLILTWHWLSISDRVHCVLPEYVLAVPLSYVMFLLVEKFFGFHFVTVSG